MNTENVDFLKDRLFFLGFGEKLHTELEKKMESHTDKFNLSIQGEFGKDDKKAIVDYNLDFTKSKQSDMYFLNNYTATLKNEKPELEKTQKFYLNNGSGITAKEAFNLLEGRAVFKNNLEKKPKEGEENQKPQKYSAWIQLDFNQKDDNGNFKPQLYNQKWNFDVDKNLAKHPIKELNEPARKIDLVKSLEKGNISQVTFLVDDKETKMFLEANPKDRNLIVYNENMKKQFQGIKTARSETTGQENSQANGQEKNNGQKVNPEQKAEGEPAEKTKKRKGIGV